MLVNEDSNIVQELSPLEGEAMTVGTSATDRDGTLSRPSAPPGPILDDSPTAARRIGP